MGIRNILILFFSAMAVSLVILILFFSLFFKNFDDVITFDTKIPESAPDIKGFYDNSKMPTDSRANSVARSTINVPPDAHAQGAMKEPVVGAGVNPGEEEALDKAPMPEDTATTEPSLDEMPTLRDAVPPTTALDPKKGEKKPALPAPKEKKPGDTADTVAPKPAPSAPKTAPAASPEAPKETGAAPKTGNYQVYLDGFGSQEAAESSLATLRAQGQNPILKQKNGKPVIQLGTFSNKDYADSLATRAGAKVKATTP